MKRTSKAKKAAPRRPKKNSARALYNAMPPMTQTLVAALIKVAALVEENGIYTDAGPLFPKEELAAALDAINAAFAEVGE